MKAFEQPAMRHENPLEAHLAAHIALARTVAAELADPVRRAGEAMLGALRAGGKILLCGNGGSAADAQHMAAELTGRYEQRHRRGLPAIALTTDSSALTAIGNDFGFERVFARQVEALGRAGDVLVAISTSGNSANVVAAARTARELGLVGIGLLGQRGGLLAELVDHPIIVPSDVTAHVQEMHIVIVHALCGLADAAFAATGPG